MKKTVLLLIMPTLLLMGISQLPLSDQKGSTPLDSSRGQSGSLSFVEQKTLALVNGSRANGYDLGLEEIALRHPAFRAGGSTGAFEAANWIKEQFESLGLEAWLEPFQFTNWTLLSTPSLIIDDDGDPGTTYDQVVIDSFQSEHCSWPTPEDGVFADLVILPLPAAASRSEIGVSPINMTEWNAITTTGKVVLIGREVRWSSSWEQTYKNKLSAQPPAAVVYTWWYDWMSFTPPMHSSAGGRPMSGLGAYYWDSEVPVGFVNYEDGSWIRNREKTMDVSANVSIRAVINTGTHFNVIGRIKGYKNPEKIIIISGHYDTVMCGGFCDNGAGTAGVLELAKVFADAVEKGFYKPSYTILFVAFASEELYLVGSINYIKQHKSEMANITAVINLDCIGSDDFYVTETNSVDGFDLDQLVSNAAQDLGITATLEFPGGSDQESFRSPSWANSFYYQYWGLDAGISDATPVEPSALLISYPLLYSDKWDMGTPGWIHTSYDNSTSTETLNWVEVEDLENHIKVAALTVVRIVPNTSMIVPDDYPSIQEAINAASAGDTIFVRNGTYYENLTVNKPLTLSGESNENTIINGTSREIAVYVCADNVTIKQFAIAAAEWEFNKCIYLNACRYSNLIDNRFISWGHPIILVNSHSNALLYNIFEGGYHWDSMQVVGSNDNIIVGNVQIESADVGLRMVNSHRNFVASNTFPVNLANAAVIMESHNNILTKNTMYGFLYGLEVVNSSGTKVFHNNLSKRDRMALLPGPAIYVENSFDSSWDAGYPDGGNHYPMYNGTDAYSGPYQNETGSDGISDTPYIIDENNRDRYPLMGLYNLSVPDIGVAGICTSKTVVDQGSVVSLYVKIVNYGVETETFNITIYVNVTTICTYNRTLIGKTFGTFQFAWNTTDFAIGSYSVTACLFPVLGENDTADNTYVYGMIVVTITGDVDENFKVDMGDIVLLCDVFGSKTGQPEYNPNCDINNNGRIDMDDIIIACDHFGQHYP